MNKINKIFVFGSNLRGVHGAGAAKFALENRGAVYGKGHGHYGNSYALPTKDRQIKTLPLTEIAVYAEVFKEYARENPDLQFQLTPVGCGLAGYKYTDIAPFFKDCPDNVEVPEEFLNVIQTTR